MQFLARYENNVPLLIWNYICYYFDRYKQIYLIELILNNPMEPSTTYKTQKNISTDVILTACSVI